MSRQMKKQRDSEEQPSGPVRYERAWLSTTDPALLRRLGNTRDRLRWLVEDFARRRNYLDRERAPEELVREVAVFLLYQNEPGTMALGKMPRLPAQVLQKLSTDIEAGVGRFLDGQNWTIPIKTDEPGIPVFSRSVRRRTIELGRDKGKTIAVASWRSRRSPRTFALTFQLAAQELVASAHEFLARCPGCATVFVRDDPRQYYCSTRCNVASRMRKHRSRKRGLPSQPHSKPKRVIDAQGTVHWPGERASGPIR